MNFGLSEEQEILQQTLEQFLGERCPATRLHEVFDGDEPFDRELWKGLMELGFGGLTVAEDFGGAGLDLMDLALASEVLGRHSAPVPHLGHSLAALAIELGGSQAQKARWLPRLASGETLGTVALAEPGGGWDPADWAIDVVRDRLSGEKSYCLAGAEADLIVVGCGGATLALVERGAAGLVAHPFDGVDRTRRLCSLSFAATPCEPLSRGTHAAPLVRDAGLCLIAADAYGGASRSLELATAYAKQREQFGVTIGHFQAIKHQLANLAAEVEPARALFWFAAHAWDTRPLERERSAALAKAHLGERFFDAAFGATEVFGGIGATWDGDIQIWLKRALFDRTYLGDTAHHRDRAARLASW